MHLAVFLWSAFVTVAPAAAQTVLELPTTNLAIQRSTTPVENVEKRFFKIRSSTKISQIPPGADRIVPPVPGGAGDPTIHGATLTVYNASGRPVVWSAPLPAAGWSINGSVTNFKGYFFKDVTPLDGPVFRLYLKFDKLFAIGGRDLWGYLLDDTPQGRVAVRLTLGTDVTLCMEAPATSPASIYDHPGRFFSPRTAAPAGCPPVP